MMDFKVTRRIVFLGDPLPEHWEIGFFPNGVGHQWSRIDAKTVAEISPVRTNGRYIVRDTKDGKFVGDVDFRRRVRTVFVATNPMSFETAGIYATPESAERACAEENGSDESPQWMVFETEVHP